MIRVEWKKDTNLPEQLQSTKHQMTHELSYQVIHWLRHKHTHTHTHRIAKLEGRHHRSLPC